MHVDLPFLCVATDNMIAARDTIRKRFADYWQNVAANLDRIARFVIPTVRPYDRRLLVLSGSLRIPSHPFSFLLIPSDSSRLLPTPPDSSRSLPTPPDSSRLRATPQAYLFSMAIVFGLNFSDDYLTNSARRMNEGAVHVSFTAAGVGWTIAFFLAGGFFHVLWYFAQRAERQHMKKRAAKEVERLGHLDRSLFNVASLHKQKTRDLHSGAPLAA